MEPFPRFDSEDLRSEEEGSSIWTATPSPVLEESELRARGEPAAVCLPLEEEGDGDSELPCGVTGAEEEMGCEEGEVGEEWGEEGVDVETLMEGG